MELFVGDTLDVEEQLHRLSDDARWCLEVDLPGSDRQGLEFELKRRAGAGAPSAPPGPEEVGQLGDGEDPLLVVTPDRLRGHPVQQAEVIVGLGLGATLGAEGQSGQWRFKMTGGAAKSRSASRPYRFQDRRDLPIVVGQDDLVGDTVEGDDLAVVRWASPESTPGHAPRTRGRTAGHR